MSKNLQDKNIRTLGYVLKRTNYGEADRILNIITPLGKISAIAKGVRKEKSRLAGGVELFSLIDFNIYRGRGELVIVTSAKMLRYYGEILKDYAKMELASEILREVSKASNSSDNERFFVIVDQCLSAINGTIDVRLVRCWFVLTLLGAVGEEVNLYRDGKGDKLAPDKNYEWDIGNKAFREDDSGKYGVNEIKMLRLMATADIELVKRIKTNEGMIIKLMEFVKLVEEGV